jgi:23S rRNA pseudouridine1911/1915/1917 synthase
MKEPYVLAENELFLVIDKPAGLIVHSDGRTQELSLADWIAEKYPALRGVGGAWISPQGEHIDLNGLVHRLDRKTSGIVIAAKTQEAFDYIREEFSERRVEKKYLAWVYGIPKEKKGIIVAEIMRSTTPPKHWYARPCAIDDPRAAVTEWKFVTSKQDASLLEVIPKTGRTHQIRVHLASIGHPIVADHLYARDREPLLGFTRPALHASQISLTLPSGERVEYEAPLPEDFSQ